MEHSVATGRGAWQVRGAAVQGTSHALHDLPCQDAYRYCVLPGGGLLIAVADGAGSARYSQFGASSAVEAGLEALRTGLEGFSPQNLSLIHI